jgi:hypothetical protein
MRFREMKIRRHAKASIKKVEYVYDNWRCNKNYPYMLGSIFAVNCMFQVLEDQSSFCFLSFLSAHRKGSF